MHVQISEAIRSVLIVEDEGLVAMLMEDLLRDLGVTDVYICADLASARVTASQADLDCAVLDHRIRGGDCTEIADILAARGIAFLFSTGGDIDAIAERHRNRPLIAKPFGDDAFKLVVLDTFARAGGRFAGAVAVGEASRVATQASTD